MNGLVSTIDIQQVNPADGQLPVANFRCSASFINNLNMTTLDFLRDVKIHQNKKGYRFSVDALLLASFSERPAAKKIADFGAGSGIIGLLLAMRCPGAKVTLIELQESLAGLAESNIALNRLEERVGVIRMDIRSLSSGNGFGSSVLHPSSFDLVVSN